ncbi:unnamed protein product [Penicillium roqueforti FM164]|uniref:Genomic scaffold, ProqFM164S01 n=1 Tax=Penicillium roqueforti (strain FM164) TaxID=1365484 RepID=W6PSK8_PENRF|nr:unnamed protein product [Penicillium roqueforti FM164]
MSFWSGLSRQFIYAAIPKSLGLDTAQGQHEKLFKGGK